jgi:hypothetical protein
MQVDLMRGAQLLSTLFLLLKDLAVQVLKL